MTLSETGIKGKKPGAKPVKLFDERGLFLIITPTGGKWWRFKYRFDGKEKLLSLGTLIWQLRGTCDSVLPERTADATSSLVEAYEFDTIRRKDSSLTVFYDNFRGQ